MVVSDTVRHQPVPGVKVEQVAVPAQLLVQVAAVVEPDSGVQAETVQRVPAVQVILQTQSALQCDISV